MRKPVDLTKFTNAVGKSLKITSGFNDPTEWVSTGNLLLNYLISGNWNHGLPLGKLSMLAGESGCLPSYAKIEVDVNGTHNVITVGELRLLYTNGSKILINTPYGYQAITNWYDKGALDMVTVLTENHKTVCATNHLIQLSNMVWKNASELQVGDTIQTISGNEEVVDVSAHIEKEECYDFTVDHPSHSYYGDGIVSHNSGKSYIASGNIVRECQKQGITPIIIDTENALDEEWLRRIGVDTAPDKLLRFSVSMINDVGKIMSLFIDDYKTEYGDLPMIEKPKFMFVIDSLGMLLTDTDVDQFDKGDMKGDFGRKPKQLTALVRNVMNKIGDCNIGVVVTNHTYASQDMFDPDDKISGGCLVAGTELITNNGIKNIEDMVIGDMVLSDDNQYHEVVNTWEYTKPTYTLELEDGQVFECSPEHKFAVVDDNDNATFEWIEAKDIIAGIRLRSFDSIEDNTFKSIRVMSTLTGFKEKQVYDIQVADTANYILKDGVVSHNSGLIYGSSIVVASKKYKLKLDEDGNKVSDVTGIRVTFKIMKTRYGRPFETANCHIRFDTGLDKYSGVLDYLIRLGVVEKQGNRWKYINDDGEEMLYFAKHWTSDKLQRIIDEWDYEKYTLISNQQYTETVEEVEEQLLNDAADKDVHSDVVE